MIQIEAKPRQGIPLGHRGENEARQIIFDLSDYISTYGPGTARLLHQRDGDPAPYIVPAVQNMDTLTWTVTDADTAAPGKGKAELQWTVGNTLAKSDKWDTRTLTALDDGSPEPPTGAEGWYQQLIAYIDSLKDAGVSEEQIAAAVEAYLADNPVDVPVTSVNGKTGAVELTAEDVGALGQDKLQTGVNTALAQAKASGEFDGAPGDPGTDGITPTIGANGNWYLGDTDTGKPSRGEAGPAGADGRDGADGQPGADGKSAYQYAQDGGYTGSEEEFTAKMAADYIQAPVAAEVGQTIVVKAADENGKPTEWETADVPSKWEHICDITITEEVATIEVTENSEGVSLSKLKYNEVWVLVKMVGVSTNTGRWWKCLATTDGGRLIQSASNGSGTNTRFTSFYLFIRGNKPYWTDGDGIDPYDLNGGNDNWLNNFLDWYNSDHFVSITVQGTSTDIDLIGVDSEIRILGRRA